MAVTVLVGLVGHDNPGSEPALELPWWKRDITCLFLAALGPSDD